MASSGVQHMGYVRAVAAALKASGMEVGMCRNQSAGDPAKRSAAMFLYTLQPWDGWKYAAEVTLEWDEELGWTIMAAHSLGPPHGWTEARYGLGVDVVAAPADVVARIDEGFDSRAPEPGPRPQRRATDHNPRLEQVLATYQST
ncbi:DUF6292 family protein [Actinophytocola xanthii]|uniref:DUF6292 domain-containing protein n=1 Tax=Actinophytocola xanthii TaxID=1912961 RepID=A0A1Q8CSW2_9PSEU|nr:DUF6292 family protein [Actinophytocola xanthii]OLF17424.1 hypothetical protein BU204_11660 [Actinophytocola xanthii]